MLLNNHMSNAAAAPSCSDINWTWCRRNSRPSTRYMVVANWLAFGLKVQETQCIWLPFHIPALFNDWCMNWFCISFCLPSASLSVAIPVWCSICYILPQLFHWHIIPTCHCRSSWQRVSVTGNFYHLDQLIRNWRLSLLTNWLASHIEDFNRQSSRYDFHWSSRWSWWPGLKRDEWHYDVRCPTCRLMMIGHQSEYTFWLMLTLSSHATTPVTSSLKSPSTLLTRSQLHRLDQWKYIGRTVGWSLQYVKLTIWWEVTAFNFWSTIRW